jgi:Xaa-Pro aminopeptidase
MGKPTKARRTASRSARPDLAGSAFADRLKRALKSAVAADAPHLLITNPLDVGYLTGFLGGDSYLLLGGKRAIVISDARFDEELEPVRALCDVHIRTNQTMLEAVASLVGDARAKRLGIQADAMTVSTRNALALKLASVKLVETSGLIAKLRAKKDAGEVALIRQANRIGEQALLKTIPELDTIMRRSGTITEANIAAILEHHMKVMGSSTPSFESIVATGASGSLPHYRPEGVKHRKGKTLLIDWGATYRGYHGDMTRVLCWGDWPFELRECYKIVLDAHVLAAKALAPGKTGREIDKLARDHIAKHSYGHRFGHSLGHGLGLNVHEGPRLSHMGEAEKLEPGHVVTIEPGIYLPGVGGIRIEDNYLITDKGAENLCSLPKSLDWASR